MCRLTVHAPPGGFWKIPEKCKHNQDSKLSQFKHDPGHIIIR